MRLPQQRERRCTERRGHESVARLRRSDPSRLTAVAFREQVTLTIRRHNSTIKSEPGVRVCRPLAPYNTSRPPHVLFTLRRVIRWFAGTRVSDVAPRIHKAFLSAGRDRATSPGPSPSCSQCPLVSRLVHDPTASSGLTATADTGQQQRTTPRTRGEPRTSKESDTLTGSARPALRSRVLRS